MENDIPLVLHSRRPQKRHFSLSFAILTAQVWVFQIGLISSTVYLYIVVNAQVGFFRMTPRPSLLSEELHCPTTITALSKPLKFRLESKCATIVLRYSFYTETDLPSVMSVLCLAEALPDLFNIRVLCNNITSLMKAVLVLKKKIDIFRTISWTFTVFKQLELKTITIWFYRNYRS